MKCIKCGCETISMTRDARGIPSAFCESCGAFIKKMSTSDVIDYYEWKIAMIPVSEDSDAVNLKSLQDELAELKKEKPLCKYCTEQYGIISKHIAIRPTLIDINYCPMCGRKRKPNDLDY